jgi:hypothetical protein
VRTTRLQHVSHHEIGFCMAANVSCAGLSGFCVNCLPKPSVTRRRHLELQIYQGISAINLA